MKTINEKILRQYIREIITESLLIEAENKTTEKIVKDIKKRVENLIASDNDEIIDLFKSLGYNFNFNAKNYRGKREELFNNLNISNEVVKDTLEAAKIIQQYTDKNGNVYIFRDETKRSQANNVRYMEDDFSKDDIYKITAMKNFIDIIGLTYLYDDNANLSNRKYGVNSKSEKDNLDFNSITDADASKYIGQKTELSRSEAKYMIKKGILDKYMQAKYGMALNIPNISYAYGNAKLPNSTLIINFDSAIGCPTWNECLVKHACYARQGEKRNPNTMYQSNKNKNLLWRSTKVDDELMNLMMKLVKAYCFDCEKCSNEIITNKLAKGTKNKIIENILTLPIEDAFFTNEVINVLSNNKKVDKIRLNENGDFVGQWLVDAWDNAAGFFNNFGISTSAYTCRHLNFEGIKSIILNTSFRTNNPNIARNFIAVPEDIYDALDETYNGTNNQLVVSNGSVNPNPQPLYNVVSNNGVTSIGDANGVIYYKCPCGRTIGDKKINCYECELCYQPNNYNQTMIVFVKAHGGGAEKLPLKTIDNFGVSKNYLSNLRKNIKESNEKIYENKNLNNTQIRIAKNDAIKTITNNAINSMNTKF